MSQVAKIASIAYSVTPALIMNTLLIEKHFMCKHGPTIRLVFTSPGTGVTATVVDFDNRFRLIVNDVECIKSKSFPQLPVHRLSGFLCLISPPEQALGFF